ncbi:gas vesicle protein GvpH [Natribaculum luteum]|uniref:Gas vesicle protein GvpH n=1 Tax=Natribaculum luteum TaxID=1586232 RepID=A0ABD5NZK8_9EURY|nr:gas vesicle protein GvpH [Natribaculum luteum]
MSGEDESERETEATDERQRGFRLTVGLWPLSNLLDSLIEVNVSSTSDEALGRTTADETVRNPRRERIENRRESTSGEYLIDTRLADDEFVVVADLPGASEDDLSAGIDPRTSELVITEDDVVIGRVGVPRWSSEATRVVFHNGVLEVRFRRTRS